MDPKITKANSKHTSVIVYLRCMVDGARHGITHTLADTDKLYKAITEEYELLGNKPVALNRAISKITDNLPQPCTTLKYRNKVAYHVSAGTRSDTYTIFWTQTINGKVLELDIFAVGEHKTNKSYMIIAAAGGSKSEMGDFVVGKKVDL